MPAHRISVQKIIIGIALSLILLNSFLLLGMPMQAGCPFMPGETALCTMSVLDHIDHWQQAFVTIVAEALVLAALTIVIRLFRNDLLRKSEPLPAPPRKRSSFSFALFQELFLAGILNPRAP